MWVVINGHDRLHGQCSAYVIIIIIIIYSAKQTRMNKTNKYKYIEKKKDKQYVTNQKTTHFKVARINKSETEPL